VDDLADACYFLLQNYNEELFVNIGTGVDLTIKELAEMIKDIVGFEGELKWNTEKPDGTPRKLMDVSRLHNLGWKHRIGLREGITNVYAEFAKSELAKA
jgi:GDP-L-fucose synthase